MDDCDKNFRTFTIFMTMERNDLHLVVFYTDDLPSQPLVATPE